MMLLHPRDLDRVPGTHLALMEASPGLKIGFHFIIQILNKLRHKQNRNYHFITNGGQARRPSVMSKQNVPVKCFVKARQAYPLKQKHRKTGARCLPAGAEWSTYSHA